MRRGLTPGYRGMFGKRGLREERMGGYFCRVCVYSVKTCVYSRFLNFAEVGGECLNVDLWVGRGCEQFDCNVRYKVCLSACENSRFRKG